MMGRALVFMALAAGLIALALTAAVTVFAEPLALRLYARQVEARLDVDRTRDLPDGLTVAFCGTGSPLPDPSRAQSCTAVIAGDRVFIVDSGAGSARNLVLMGVRGRQVEALLLTHFHSDHISDAYALALQRWVDSGQTTPLTVYGPAGVDAVMSGFSAAYALDGSYRTGHHGEAIAPPGGFGFDAVEFAGGEGGPVTVFQDTDLTIRAMRVDHEPASPAVAYRFDYKGRSAVISGDLILERSPHFADLARGADLLVMEALQPRLVSLITQQARLAGRPDLATITDDILDYHTTPEAAADAARIAGARALMLTHIVPALPSRLLHPAFLGDARSRFSGPLRIAEDGAVVVMPAGSDAVRFEDWL